MTGVQAAKRMTIQHVLFNRVVCSKLVVQLSRASAFVCAPRPRDMTQSTTHGGQNNIRLPSFSSQTQYRRSHSVTTSNCGHCRCWLHHVPPYINSLSQPHRQPGILHSGQQASNGMPQTDYFSGKCPQGDYICTIVVWFRSCICVLCDVQQKMHSKNNGLCLGRKTSRRHSTNTGLTRWGPQKCYTYKNYYTQCMHNTHPALDI